MYGYNGFNPYNNPYQDNGFEAYRREQKRLLRRDANYIGFGMLGLLAAMQFTYLLACLLLIALRVIPLQAIHQADLGLGNTVYLIFYMLVYMIAMGFPMVLVSLIARRRVNPFSPAKRVNAVDFLLALAAGLAMCVIANFAASYIMSILQAFGIQQPSMPDTMVNTPLSLGLNILIFAVLPAFLEEMVFRGYVLQALRPHGDGMAVVVSALLFGLMHGNVLQIPFAFLIGLVLGYVVVQADNIWIAVSIHFLNNFMSVMLQYVGFHTASDEAFDRLSLMVFVIIGLVGLGAVIVLAARRSRLTQRVQGSRSPLTASERTGAMLSAPAFTVAVVLFVIVAMMSIEFAPV